ncbi:MAG: hypothetical protein DRN71_01395 [Candidatus Nanohalarchaeota archaeon]|nr:MAG: hypothetical protein DRN71_01395 [Candidatus Nanohaloarchaeota archaeon]
MQGKGFEPSNSYETGFLKIITYAHACSALKNELNVFLSPAPLTHKKTGKNPAKILWPAGRPLQVINYNRRKTLKIIWIT